MVERGHKSALVGDDLEKFSCHQRREHQFRALLSFGLNRSEGFRIGRMIGNGKLNQDVAIQTNHSAEHVIRQIRL